MSLAYGLSSMVQIALNDCISSRTTPDPVIIRPSVRAGVPPEPDGPRSSGPAPGPVPGLARGSAVRRVGCRTLPG